MKFFQIVFLFLFLLPGYMAGQSSDFDQLYKEGKELYDSKEYLDAFDKFYDAMRLREISYEERRVLIRYINRIFRKIEISNRARERERERLVKKTQRSEDRLDFVEKERKSNYKQIKNLSKQKKELEYLIARENAKYKVDSLYSKFKFCYQEKKNLGLTSLAEKDYENAELLFRDAKKCEDCQGRRISEIELLIDSTFTLQFDDLKGSLGISENLNLENIINENVSYSSQEIKALRAKSCYEAYRTEGKRYLSLKQFDKAEKHFKAARRCDDCKEEKINEIEKLTDLAIAYRVANLEGLLGTANKFNSASIRFINNLKTKQEELTESRRALDQALVEALFLSNKNETLAEANAREAEAARITVEATSISNDDHTLELQLAQEAVTISENQSQIAKYTRAKILNRPDDRYYKQVYRGHEGAVNKIIAFKGKDGKQYLVSGSFDRTVKLWDFETGEEIRSFNGHRYGITSLAISKDRNTLITGGRDSVAILWDIWTGEKKASLRKSHGPIYSVLFSPDEKYILTNSKSEGDMIFQLWDAETGNPLDVLGSHKKSLSAIAFSEDEKYMLTAGSDQTILLWKIGGNPFKIKKIRTYKDKNAEKGFSAIAFIPSRDAFIAGDLEGNVSLWDLKNRKKPIARFQAHDGYISSVAPYYPDNNDLSWLSTFKSTGGYSPDGLVNVGMLIKSPGDFYSNNFFFLTGSKEQSFKLLMVSLFEKGKKGMVNEINSYFGHSGPVNQVVSTKDSGETYIISAGDDGTLKKWNTDYKYEGELHTQIANYVSAAAISPDGSYIAYNTSKDGSIYLKSFRDLSGMKPPEVKGHTGFIEALEFSPNGKFILSGGRDNLAKLWKFDPESEEGFISEMLTLTGHDSVVKSVAFSAPCNSQEDCPIIDSKYILTGSKDSTARLWRLSSDQKVETIQIFKNRGPVYDVGFSPDGKYVFTVATGGYFYFWPINPEGKKQEDIQPILTVQGHSHNVLTADISPNGRFLLTGSLDKTAKLWEIYQNNSDGIKVKEIQEFKIDRSSVTKVKFSPDGNYFYIGTAWGKVVMYELNDYAINGQYAIEIGTVLDNGGNYRIFDFVPDPRGSDKKQLMILNRDKDTHDFGSGLYYDPISRIDNIVPPFTTSQKIKYQLSWKESECLDSNVREDLETCIEFYEKAYIYENREDDLDKLKPLYQKAYGKEMLDKLPGLKIRNLYRALEEKSKTTFDQPLLDLYKKIMKETVDYWEARGE